MGRSKNKRKNTCQAFKKPHYLTHNINYSKMLPSTSKQEFDKKNDNRDNKGRRIILKEILYEDPELYKKATEPVLLYKDSMRTYGIEWTTPNWQRAGNEEVNSQQCSKTVIVPKKLNKLEKNLNKMLAQPVQMTKAEKMMAKMGWDGGALGKNGEGIIEPIAPNAAYASATYGLGKTTENIKIPKKMARKQNKQFFQTNVLNSLLEFIKNDSEIEMTFDSHLSKQERKSIHDIVGAFMGIGNNTVNINFNTERQKTLVQNIHNNNKFVLSTESDGVPPNRYLCLYKDAPEYMYLVTPDDLCVKNSEDVPDNSEQNNKIHQKIDTFGTIDAKVEDNLDLSIDDECTEELLLEIIIDYFMEFLDDKDYTEFRFLGLFRNNERQAINMFMEKYTNSQFYEDRMKSICESKEIAIHIRNFNGSSIFYKVHSKMKVNEMGVTIQ